MISFTVRGKNFHPRAKYWIPIVYNSDYNYYIPVGWDGKKRALLTETASFSKTPENVGFMVTMQDANQVGIYEPYAFAGTTPSPLKDGGKYILDFHGEVGFPTLLEEEIPGWELLGILAFLLPHWPWIGPPVPSFLPPWPWYEG